jgi:hypothetical protein
MGCKFYGDDRCLKVWNKDGKLKLAGRDEGDGFWSVRHSDVKAFLNTNISLTENLARYYSAEELNRAEQAYNMCAQLGHCGEVSLKAALDHGSIAGTHLTSRDVQNA